MALVLARGRAPLFLLAAALLVLQAWSLSRERWGLVAEYRSQADGGGHVVRRQIEADPSISPDGIAVLRPEYSVRWTGWIRIEEEGRYWFTTRSGGSSSIEIRGKNVLENAGGQPPRSVNGRVHLRRGLHPIVVGLSKTPGRWHLLETRFGRKLNQLEAIPATALFASRPGRYRQLVRSATRGLSLDGRRALAGVLLVPALLLVWLALRPHAGSAGRAWLAAREQLTAVQSKRRYRAAFLVALFAFAFFASLPFAGSPYGYDDLFYMQLAQKTEAFPWVLNRYAHVYVLKPFFALTGGDAFQASEIYWSFMFAATVTAMGAAIMSLGAGYQILTLLAALLLLLSQPMLFERIGAAYSDYTVMMLVTVGVAVYLHGLARARGPTWNWVSFVLGLATFWATKSKELGAVLLWLLPLLAFEEGRLRWRSFAKKLGFWVAGAAVGLVALMVLDAIYLGDGFFAVRPDNINRVGSFNFAQTPESHSGWMATLWRGHHVANPGDASAGLLAIFVVLAAAAATWRQRTLELRLVHLMPMGYLAALILMNLRATYPYIPRYLYPILPVACVLAAALFHYAGLDDLDWSRLASPRFFVPAILVAAAPWAVLSLLPFDKFARAGWTPELFVPRVLMPLVLMGLLALFAAFFHIRSVRLALLALAAALLFAPYFSQTSQRLATRFAVSRAEASLYPFRTFAKELEETEVAHLAVSPNVLATRMCGGYKLACKRIVRLWIDPEVQLTFDDEYNAGATFTLGTDTDVEAWAQNDAGLRSRAVFDPTRSVALIRSPHVPLPESIWTRAVPKN